MSSIIKVTMIIQRRKLNKNGKTLIFARITMGGRSVLISTKMETLPERWSGEKTLGLTKAEKLINTTLDEIRAAIYNTHKELIAKGVTITLEKLRDAFKGKDVDDTQRYYVAVFDCWLNDYLKLVGISTTKRTYDKYVLVRNRLAEFIHYQYHRNDILLADVTPKFLTDFDTYLRTTYQVANNVSIRSSTSC